MKRFIPLVLVLLALSACLKEKLPAKTLASQSLSPNITYPATNNLTVGTMVNIAPSNTGGTVPATVYGQVTTFAGAAAPTTGFVDGTGASVQFNDPQAMAGDVNGNLYVADALNNAIRKISPAGVVTTFAGSTTGLAGFTDSNSPTSALFNFPDGLAFDASGNLFVADNLNNAIRKVTPAGVVSTFYQGVTPFQFNGICFDGAGNLMVTTGGPNPQVLKISPSGIATSLAGSTPGDVDGTGASALFGALGPTDIVMDATGDFYVADDYNNAIRKLTSAGVVTTVAGPTSNVYTVGYVNGVGAAVRFYQPIGIALTSGGVLYIADYTNANIRRMMPDGTVSLAAGSPTQVQGNQDGIGTNALMYCPIYIYIDSTGTGYITQNYINNIRKIILTGYSINGSLPPGLTFDPKTGVISGTPTAAFTTTTYTVTGFNANGFSSSTFTITVN